MVRGEEREESHENRVNAKRRWKAIREEREEWQWKS